MQKKGVPTDACANTGMNAAHVAWQGCSNVSTWQHKRIISEDQRLTCKPWDKLLLFCSTYLLSRLQFAGSFFVCQLPFVRRKTPNCQ